MKIVTSEGVNHLNLSANHNVQNVSTNHNLLNVSANYIPTKITDQKNQTLLLYAQDIQKTLNHTIVSNRAHTENENMLKNSIYLFLLIVLIVGIILMIHYGIKKLSQRKIKGKYVQNYEEL